MTPDRALDLAGRTDHEPVLRRVDARTMAVHEYATIVDHGRGRLFATTLRFGGGLGDQAAGVGRNVCAQGLLESWASWFVSGAATDVR